MSTNLIRMMLEDAGKQTIDLETNAPPASISLTHEDEGPASCHSGQQEKHHQSRPPRVSFYPCWSNTRQLATGKLIQLG